MKRNLIPIAEIGPVVRELIEERWPHGSGYDVLAEKLGCDQSAIYGIAMLERESADFDLVDTIFCGLGRPDLWRGRFADIYHSADLKMGHCQNPFCDVLLVERRPGKGGRRRTYCSGACRSNADKLRTGESKRRRKHLDGRPQRGYRFPECRKGHRLTDENRTKDGRCLICRRASWREGQRAVTARKKAIA